MGSDCLFLCVLYNIQPHGVCALGCVFQALPFLYIFCSAAQFLQRKPYFSIAVCNKLLAMGKKEEAAGQKRLEEVQGSPSVGTWLRYQLHLQCVCKYSAHKDFRNGEPRPFISPFIDHET